MTSSRDAPAGRIEIGLSRRAIARRLFWLVPLAAIIVIGAVYLTTRVATGASLEALGVSGVWIFTGLVLAVAVVDSFRVLTYRGAVVVLDSEGVLDRRVMRRPLPWSKARRAEIRTQDGAPVFVGFWVEEAAGRYRRRAPLFNYFGLVDLLAVLAARYRFPPLSIELQTLDAAPETVIDAVRRFWGEPERRENPQAGHDAA